MPGSPKSAARTAPTPEGLLDRLPLHSAELEAHEDGPLPVFRVGVDQAGPLAQPPENPLIWELIYALRLSPSCLVSINHFRRAWWPIWGPTQTQGAIC